MELCKKYNIVATKYVYGECLICNSIYTERTWLRCSWVVHLDHWRNLIERVKKEGGIPPEWGQPKLGNGPMKCPNCSETVEPSKMKVMRANKHPSKGGEYVIV